MSSFVVLPPGSMGQAGDDPLVVPGSLRGYRLWRFLSVSPTFYDKTSVLWPMNFNTHPWIAGMNEAVCLDRGCTCYLHESRNHETGVPVRSCSCGLYGYYKPGYTGITRYQIAGSFEASGRVILHQRGFRAQKAVISALAVDVGLIAPKAYEDLKRIYQVPIFDSIEQLLEEFPPTPVTSLLPTPRVLDVRSFEDEWLKEYLNRLGT